MYIVFIVFLLVLVLGFFLSSRSAESKKHAEIERSVRYVLNADPLDRAPYDINYLQTNLYKQAYREGYRMGKIDAANGTNDNAL